MLFEFFFPIKKKRIFYSCIKFHAFFDSLSIFYSVIFDLKRYVHLVLILHNATSWVESQRLNMVINSDCFETICFLLYSTHHQCLKIQTTMWNTKIIFLHYALTKAVFSIKSWANLSFPLSLIFSSFPCSAFDLFSVHYLKAIPFIDITSLYVQLMPLSAVQFGGSKGQGKSQLGVSGSRKPFHKEYCKLDKKFDVIFLVGLVVRCHSWNGLFFACFFPLHCISASVSFI